MSWVFCVWRICALLNHILNGRRCVRAEEDLTGARAYCVLSACARTDSLVCGARKFHFIANWSSEQMAFCIRREWKRRGVCVAKVNAAAIMGRCECRGLNKFSFFYSSGRFYIVWKINLLVKAAHLLPVYRFATAACIFHELWEFSFMCALLFNLEFSGVDESSGDEYWTERKRHSCQTCALQKWHNLHKPRMRY